MARQRRRQDAYGKRARKEGYAARSVYKLEEIDQRVRLLRRGQRVLDLGAAPGSWTVYAAERVGREGRVLAVDLSPLRSALLPQVEARQADVTTVDPESLGTFEVVLSDMAPSTSGHRSLDQARSHRLFMTALALATEVLAPGGHFVGKIFQGPDFEEARAALRAAFGETRIVRPKATRGESFETFLVGRGKRA